MGLVRVKWWEKRNRTDFYWVMLLMYTIWEYWNLCQQFKNFCEQFHFFFFSGFGTNIFKTICSSILCVCVCVCVCVCIYIYIYIYIANIRTLYIKLDIFMNFINIAPLIFWAWNVLILPSPKVFQRGRYVPVGEMFLYAQFVYYFTKQNMMLLFVLKCSPKSGDIRVW